MISISKKFSFSAAHRLPMHQGLCKNLHGHSYHLIVTITGVPNGDPASAEFGMMMDFGELKKIVTEEIIQKMDHQYLNDQYENPTAEKMIEDISLKLKMRINSDQRRVTHLKLFETETSCANWRE